MRDTCAPQLEEARMPQQRPSRDPAETQQRLTPEHLCCKPDALLVLKGPKVSRAWVPAPEDLTTSRGDEHSPAPSSAQGLITMVHGYPQPTACYVQSTNVPSAHSFKHHLRLWQYKLNKQGDNIQAWATPFPIWNQSVVPCPVLTVASWPAYRFLKRQVRWSGSLISFKIFYSLLWSTQSEALA